MSPDRSRSLRLYNGLLLAAGVLLLLASLGCGVAVEPADLANERNSAAPDASEVQFRTRPVRPAHVALIPPDKDPTQIYGDVLWRPGEKETYSGADLEPIGMPVGGIGAGQLYLCGDGTLGDWMIFNDARSFWVPGTHSTWARRIPERRFDQGFAVVIRHAASESVRPLNAEGFADVTFRGEYPIGIVTYRDPAAPVAVTLEAYSPFIPGQAHDSALPATVFNVTVQNISAAPLQAQVLGWLENAVKHEAPPDVEGHRWSRRIAGPGRTLVLHGASPPALAGRPPIVLADFEGEDFGDWQVEGQAFGSSPVHKPLSGQQVVTGFEGRGLANSFKGAMDTEVGVLRSPLFTIEREFLNLLVGGGRYTGNETLTDAETQVVLFVDGRQVAAAAGDNTEQLKWHTWHVGPWMGRQAHIEIVDNARGGWGHILADQIELADRPRVAMSGGFERTRDYGTLAWAVAQAGAEAAGHAWLDARTTHPLVGADAMTSYPLHQERWASLAVEPRELAPGEAMTTTYVMAWHFPNLYSMNQWVGRMYAERFTDAAAAASYVLDQHPRLEAGTRSWRDTYYDSTLPCWLLDRIHSTYSYLATGTCEWWANGRFYAYEGVICCAGTCTHVWNYAQGHARLFPELGRNIRVMQDLAPRSEGGGFHPESGLVGFRGDDNYAADGQCAVVLNAYREHLMSADGTFLARYWPRIRKALEFLIANDGNFDGLIENKQHNTYDIDYYGANTMVGSLYLAALAAGERMASEVGDRAFATHVRVIRASGRRLTLERLWDGEYFIQDVDLTEHPFAQYGHGCLSDQLFGQTWAHQLGLGYLYPEPAVKSALRAVWRYNWAPRVGDYNAVHPPGRWFIEPDNAGLLTCTWPKSPYLPNGTVYKNEVWTGIEYQVASGMIEDGLVMEGLAICRAVHERYRPQQINPYNEVECGDHYIRALASWGVLTGLSGYRYDGPAGRLGFGPRLTPERFRAPFTVAEGWGTFEQTREPDRQIERIVLRRGRLRLEQLSFRIAEGDRVERVGVELNGREVGGRGRTVGNEVRLTLGESCLLVADDELVVRLRLARR